MPSASEQAEIFLEEHKETQQRFDRVADLIKGFETSFGMELLSTVHWVAIREEAVIEEEVITKIHAWNTCKGMFESRHIHLAWEQLRKAGWMA
jgi:hypothetical protein